MLCLVSGGPATLSGRDSSPSSRNDSSWRWFRLARGYRLRVAVLHEMALAEVGLATCASGLLVVGWRGRATAPAPDHHFYLTPPPNPA